MPGAWIQNIAMGWLVFRLTDSALILGLVGFASQIPAFFITPIAGVFADKLDRRKVLITTQAVAMAVALSLAFLILTDRIQVAHILIGAVVAGVAAAIDNPFRHAFLVNLLDDRKDLPNAIALNSTMYNSARFIGPPIGGFLVAYAGEGMCFLINGLSYTAVLYSLISMKVPKFVKSTDPYSVVKDLLGGFKYAYTTRHLRILLTMVIVISLVGLPFQVFMPVFAKDILGGDSQTMGFLTGSLGAGALTGALLLANRSSINRFPLTILTSALMFGTGLGIFTLSGNFYLSAMALVLTGAGMVVMFAACNTLLQTLVKEDMRGRIVALYSMSFMGFTPIGSMLVGSITEFAGLQTTLSMAALLCILIAIWYRGHLKEIKAAVES